MSQHYSRSSNSHARERNRVPIQIKSYETLMNNFWLVYED